MTFTNPAQRKERTSNGYQFDMVPNLLKYWNREFQSLVAITLSKFYAKGGHLPSWKDTNVTIYKFEGGCRVIGGGELVLSGSTSYYTNRNDAVKENELITLMVLGWDPMNPIDSLVRVCGDFLNKELSVPSSKEVDTYQHLHEDFKDVMEKANSVFSGDPLRNFFERTSGTNELYEQYRDHCLIKYEGWSQEKLDQSKADKRIGEELLMLMNRVCNKHNNGGYGLSPLCCSPRRSKDGSLNFWINTGRSTQIDGWKTEQEIRDWIKSDEPLVDKWRS